MSRNRTVLSMVTIAAVAIVAVATGYDPGVHGWPAIGASGLTFAVAALLDEVI